MSDTTEKLTFTYVTYIRSTPDTIWHALTDADLTGRYWGHSNVSDWQVGSSWEHVRADGSGTVDGGGTVLEASPSKRLVMTFPTAGPSKVTFGIEEYREIAQLTVTHEDLAGPGDRDAVAAGWPAVLSNLKSLLETGEVLPQKPWEMLAALKDTSRA
ncbi:GntR family transcriptional regulator [Streptomyces sp. R302]|uniref:SRPBCC family protein n=1 Tax=unclassified Streptomyces TaxID=2593676 RepID=UPI00145D56C0|nr:MULTISPECIES: SRPBCC family protein [unclassified Streptomyces]NML51013.1 GntR family transcriptional regulator [Streptomyces sp. R301]NML81107.1 GntR family transcriptional regulator [Streptomyces sp. R302]